jgi:hypothetical protein
MRYDFFIIWGNGLKHTYEIVDIIRSRFKIVFEKGISFQDTEKFIRGVYGCDKAPIAHLIAKSRYLHKAEKRAYFILVENPNPKPRLTRTGEQCDNIQEVKILIRNKFNPKFADTGRRIAPLNRGVSHEHVIHASDYESQVFYVLDYLGFPSLDYFREFDNSIDIVKVLKDASGYVAVRMSEDFPNYREGSDIDIFCQNIEQIKTHIQKKVKVKVKVKGDKHIQLDYFKGGKLNLKFDLYEGIVDNKERKMGVWVPGLEDEIRIRKAELMKYPHKLHHKKFINENSKG